MRWLIASCTVAILVGDAAANGRPPAVSTIHFRKGSDSHILAGLTFGLIRSDDGGATWQWMCEKAVGYGGLYDPSYSYSSSGAVFATTFCPNCFAVMRDGCTFTPITATPPGSVFVSQDTIGPDGHVYITAADGTVGRADSKIYESSDDGVTFPQSATPPGLMNSDWWDSIIVAPSDPTRIYLSGYRFVTGTKSFLLFKSTDAGVSFNAISTANITTAQNSAIDIVGVSPTDPNVVYARSTLENNIAGDGLYVSTDAGATWTGILHKPDSLWFVARKDGSIVAGSQSAGTFSSTNQGTSWTQITNAPHINCLAENAAGELWACTQNYGVPGIPSDGFGIMKSTDLQTWTGVLKFQDIAGPVTCPAGTAQQDQCVEPYMGMPSVWCVLRCQLGITSTAVADCPACLTADAPAVDTTIIHVKKGCCDAGGASSSLLLGGLVAIVLLRGRRRAVH